MFNVFVSLKNIFQQKKIIDNLKNITIILFVDYDIFHV